MKAQKLIFSITKRAIGILFLFISLIGQAQENFWEAKPKGANPWANDLENTARKEEKSSSTRRQESASSVIEGQPSTTSTDSSASSVSKVYDKNYAANQSTSTVRYFNFNDTIIELNATSLDHYKLLRLQGKKMHKAKGAMDAGIATASFFNILALPVNLIASAIPTPLTKYKIEQFIKDNPHATLKEVRAVKIGISEKRFSNAVAGVSIGIAINVVAIISISSAIF